MNVVSDLGAGVGLQGDITVDGRRCGQVRLKLGAVDAAADVGSCEEKKENFEELTVSCMFRRRLRESYHYTG